MRKLDAAMQGAAAAAETVVVRRAIPAGCSAARVDDASSSQLQAFVWA